MAPYPLVGWLVGSSIGRSVCRSVGGSSFSFRQLLIPPMLLPNPHGFIHQWYVAPTCRSTIVTMTTSSRHLPWALAKVEGHPFIPVLVHRALSLSPSPCSTSWWWQWSNGRWWTRLPSICGAFFFNPTRFHLLLVKHPSLLLDHCDDDYLLTPSSIGFG